MCFFNSTQLHAQDMFGMFLFSSPQLYRTCLACCNLVLYACICIGHVWHVFISFHAAVGHVSHFVHSCTLLFRVFGMLLHYNSGYCYYYYSFDYYSSHNYIVFHCFLFLFLPSAQSRKNTYILQDFASRGSLMLLWFP